MTDERIVVLDLVRHSGLNAIAQECHRLAVARGEYLDSWDLWTGYTHMDNELEAWWDAAQCGDSAGEIEEMGDLLHTVLSVAHHRGIDVEQALRDAMQRMDEAEAKLATRPAEAVVGELEGKVRKLADILRRLVDLQEGPPLPSTAPVWELVMDEAFDALKEVEG